MFSPVAFGFLTHARALKNIFSMFMLFTITKLCGFKIKKLYIIICLAVGIIMFGIVATSGILPWYYESVSLEVVDGATKLIKEYGPLHPVYLVYLLSYFILMIVTIILSVAKKKIGKPKFAGLIAGIVCGNLIVWIFEKFISWDFEFLSVTYIISELLLLLVFWMMQDYIPIRDVPKHTPEPRGVVLQVATMPMEEKVEKSLANLKEGESLSEREYEILKLILENKKRKDIAESMHLSENTIKTYTRNLYNKLGVSSRDELYGLLLKK